MKKGRVRVWYEIACWWTDQGEHRKAARIVRHLSEAQAVFDAAKADPRTHTVEMEMVRTEVIEVFSREEEPAHPHPMDRYVSVVEEGEEDEIRKAAEVNGVDPADILSPEPGPWDE